MAKPRKPGARKQKARNFKAHCFGCGRICYQAGDWVVITFAGRERPAKVVEADRERIVVSVRTATGDRSVYLDTPAPRIRWDRRNGRRVWRPL